MEIGNIPALAATSKSFAHPPLVRTLGVSAIGFFAVVCLFVASLPFLEPDKDHRLLVLSCLVVFGACLYVSVAMVRRFRDTVVVADDGLWRHSPGGQSLVIPWNEIAAVEAQNVMQRLVVTDASGSRRIDLEYHLENFGELRRIVMKRIANKS